MDRSGNMKLQYSQTFFDATKVDLNQIGMLFSFRIRDDR
jgi:hypothetical protein